MYGQMHRFLPVEQLRAALADTRVALLARSLAAHSHPAPLGRFGNMSSGTPRDNLGECSRNPQNQS
jgi:hypothetical protein